MELGEGRDGVLGWRSCDGFNVFVSVSEVQVGNTQELRNLA